MQTKILCISAFSLKRKQEKEKLCNSASASSAQKTQVSSFKLQNESRTRPLPLFWPPLKLVPPIFPTVKQGSSLASTAWVRELNQSQEVWLVLKLNKVLLMSDFTQQASRYFLFQNALLWSLDEIPVKEQTWGITIYCCYPKSANTLNLQHILEAIVLIRRKWKGMWL